MCAHRAGHADSARVRREVFRRAAGCWLTIFRENSQAGRKLCVRSRRRPRATREEGDALRSRVHSALKVPVRTVRTVH